MGNTQVFCLMFSFLSMIFDVKWEKVPNCWNLCGMLTVLVLYEKEWNMLLGTLLPFLILFPLFLCKMIGTGDIKVFMVLGCAMGMEKVFLCMVYSFLIGACISLPILIFRCDVRQRFTYFFSYLHTVFITKTVPPYLAPGIHPENIHFTIPIFCSVVLLIAKGGYL